MGYNEHCNCFRPALTRCHPIAEALNKPVHDRSPVQDLRFSGKAEPISVWALIY